MKRVTHYFTFFGLVLFLSLVSLLVSPNVLSDSVFLTIQSNKSTIATTEQEQLKDTEKLKYTAPRLLFVGDVMLGRAVESFMDEQGELYPFEMISDDIKHADLAVANFEGVVPAEHIHTPSMTFRFSIKDAYLKTLHDVGFDVLSRANNHSFDYGKEGFEYMKSRCFVHGLVCRGNPFGIQENSSAIVEVKNKKVGILFLHTLYDQPRDDLILSIGETFASSTDIQVAYIHWGDEYALVHNTHQENLAHKIIDAGFDVVIGHHPHVVQDIAFYKDKPIFYSLGNFVFDQYFSRDVQQGLVLEVELGENETMYTLVPVETYSNRAQPKKMNSEDAKELFQRILPKNKLPESVSTNTLSFTTNR